MKFPRLYPVRQTLRMATLADPAGALRAEFAHLDLPPRGLKGKRLALAVGSRGIANLPLLVRTTVDLLKEGGAVPFVVPAMGSHGGATAAGQRQVLANLGVTAKTAGCPIRASMKTVELGRAEGGIPIHFDAHASESDGILILNRVKPHTAFTGPYESGLLKMLAVGLGKQKGAEALHDLGLLALRERVPAVGAHLLKSLPVLAAIAVVENGIHQTAKIHVLQGDQILQAEPRLLRSAKALMPRLPFPEIDVLVLDEIGKDIAGSGMDLKVVGRAPGIPQRSPKIRYIVVRALSPESHGNAMGIGVADFITERLLAQRDREVTRMNALTANAPDRARVPIAFPTDRETIAAALASVRDRPPEAVRLAWVRNTLELEHVLVSPALLPAVESSKKLTVTGPPQPMRFSPSGDLHSVR